MWSYTQKTGELCLDGEAIAQGYSGFGAGKNNPLLESVPNMGPIPRGCYTIGEVRDREDLGPVVMPLTPDPGNQMFGRSGFWIHGDSIEHLGCASHGCVILPRPARLVMSTANDRRIQVV